MSEEKTQKNYMQYSKKIMTFVACIWAMQRQMGGAAIMLKPETASAVNAFLSGSDNIMVVAIGFYTGNSVTEKGILGYFHYKANENESSNG